MAREVVDYAVEKSRELMAAATCSKRQKTRRRPGWTLWERRKKLRRQRHIWRSWNRIS